MSRVLILSLACLQVACWDPGTQAEPVPAYLFPDVLHTGYDGSHAFRVPVGTNLEGDVTWELQNGAVATVEPIATPASLAEVAKTWVMLTTTGVGTTKLVAQKGGQRAEATLVVAAYEADAVELGEQRYHNPTNPGAPGRASCASCHVEEGGAGVEAGVDHSPVSMALYTDEEILSVITTSAYPGGYVVEGGNHKLDLTAAEREGIVPYMRSIPPRGF